MLKIILKKILNISLNTVLRAAFLRAVFLRVVLMMSFFTLGKTVLAWPDVEEQSSYLRESELLCGDFTQWGLPEWGGGDAEGAEVGWKVGPGGGFDSLLYIHCIFPSSFRSPSYRSPSYRSPSFRSGPFEPGSFGPDSFDLDSPDSLGLIAELVEERDKSVEPSRGEFSGLDDDSVSLVFLDTGKEERGLSVPSSVDERYLAAVSCSDKRTALAMLRMGARLECRFKSHDTALTHAAMTGNGDLVGFLIGQNADVNAINPASGNTGAHHAALMGNKAVLSLLIGAGANLNAKNNEGETPLQLAIFNGHAGLFRILTSKKLISHGRVNLDLQDRQGNTALHIAALVRNHYFLNLLIDRGASQFIRNGEGETASDLYMRLGLCRFP